MKTKRNVLRKIYIALIFLFLYAPIVTLMVLSFNASRTRAKWGGFTLNGTFSCSGTASYWKRFLTRCSLRFFPPQSLP